jgi:hypothetical protein
MFIVFSSLAAGERVPASVQDETGVPLELYTVIMAQKGEQEKREWRAKVAFALERDV